MHSRDAELYQADRQQMVDCQLRNRNIRDPVVLRAMERVPRHLFVPEDQRAYAYQDSPLPIGFGQTISQPYMVALMTELLDLSDSESVLEIGTGCGYHTAVLASLAGSVYTVELVRRLSYRAQRVLASLGFRNIRFRIGDGYQGWPQHAPYDGILVTCAPQQVPPPLEEQLAEGGRMVIPVGEGQPQQLYLIRKRDGNLEREAVIPCLFVPLVHREVLGGGGPAAPEAG